MHEMPSVQAMLCCLKILREQLTSLAIQMNAIKESLGDFSVGLNTHPLHYHTIYQPFMGKQLAA